MSTLDELQVCLVPLLQTLQQQLVLGPLQFQLPHLGHGMEGGDGWRVPQAAWGSRPTSPALEAIAPLPLTWASSSASRA